MTAIISDINDILHKHGINSLIDRRDVTITDRTVSDFAKSISRLSDCITDHLWPSIPAAQVYHYTSWEAAESILTSGRFRFQNLGKRYGEGEIETFCRSHRLDGYLEPDVDGNPGYKNLLMPNTFYASFTETDLSPDEEEYFWRTFAPCDGVRLTIQVEAANPNFRRILYEPVPGNPIPVLADLTSTIRRKYNREFLLTGISRLSAFYLSGAHYKREKECRLLCKTWKEIGPHPIGTGAGSYLEVPIGSMTELGYKLDIVDVCANSRPNMPSNYVFTKRGA